MVVGPGGLGRHEEGPRKGPEFVLEVIMSPKMDRVDGCTTL